MATVRRESSGGITFQACCFPSGNLYGDPDLSLSWRPRGTAIFSGRKALLLSTSSWSVTLPPLFFTDSTNVAVIAFFILQVKNPYIQGKDLLSMGPSLVPRLPSFTQQPRFTLCGQRKKLGNLGLRLVNVALLACKDKTHATLTVLRMLALAVG